MRGFSLRRLCAPRETTTSIASCLSLNRRAFSATGIAGNAAATNDTSSSQPLELQFFTDFSMSEADYHGIMLAEAHRKHGVFLNVPPQLPPVGAPPDVPDVIMNAATLERMRTMTLAYEPTHGPPPFHTAGTRGLESLADTAITARPAITASGANTTAADKGGPSQATVGERKAPDALNRFHCSDCGKGFRVKIAGDHHVQHVHAAASLVDGPGPGEVIASTEDTKGSAKTATDAKTAVTTPAVALQGPAPSPAQYKVATLTLPEDTDVDSMMADIWDALGPNLGGATFKASTAAVAGVADKRPPPGSEDSKPTFYATPAGVAPGVKKTSTGKSIPKNAQGKDLSVKEMSSRFDNPFGDDSDEIDFNMDADNRNPFLLEEADAATPPPSSHPVFDFSKGAGNAARLPKRFECHLCDRSFRLLDGLESHYEESHAMVMPSDVLERSLNVRTTEALYAKLTEQRKQRMSSAAEANAAAISLANEENASGSKAPPIAAEEDVRLHVRAHSNTVLIGEITEIRRGFVKTHSVTQLTVRTVHSQQPPLASDQQKDAYSLPDETELITVRCFGDLFQTGVFMSELRVGVQVYINGVLRMNRHLDAVSNMRHAYPYVAVVPPLGSISMIE